MAPRFEAVRYAPNEASGKKPYRKWDETGRGRTLGKQAPFLDRVDGADTTENQALAGTPEQDTRGGRYPTMIEKAARPLW